MKLISDIYLDDNKYYIAITIHQFNLLPSTWTLNNFIVTVIKKNRNFAVAISFFY